MFRGVPLAISLEVLLGIAPEVPSLIPLRVPSGMLLGFPSLSVIVSKWISFHKRIAAGTEGISMGIL